jgi:hypothetical protein
MRGCACHATLHETEKQSRIQGGPICDQPRIHSAERPRRGASHAPGKLHARRHRLERAAAWSRHLFDGSPWQHAVFRTHVSRRALRSTYFRTIPAPKYASSSKRATHAAHFPSTPHSAFARRRASSSSAATSPKSSPTSSEPASAAAITGAVTTLSEAASAVTDPGTACSSGWQPGIRSTSAGLATSSRFFRARSSRPNITAPPGTGIASSTSPAVGIHPSSTATDIAAEHAAVAESYAIPSCRKKHDNSARTSALSATRRPSLYCSTTT